MDQHNRFSLVSIRGGFKVVRWSHKFWRTALLLPKARRRKLYVEIILRLNNLISIKLAAYLAHEQRLDF